MFSADRNNIDNSRAVLKKLPITLLKLAGSVLYRYVG
jgi:hypothetical protein